MVMAGENQSTQRRACPSTMCLLDVPRGLEWDLTSVSMTRHWQLTA